MANNLLGVKQRQKYLKKLGYYTKKVDGKEGSGTKLAYEFFNITFLNKKTNKYSSDTDTKLREVYKSYAKSKYMTSSDWKFFKDFKLTEFKCTCNGKYCDGYNGRKNKCYMRLIMTLQYVRNYYDDKVSISSGVRCPKRNSQVGGVKNSKHLVFKAADFKVKKEKSKLVVKLLQNFPLVDYTYSINDYYTHANV